MKVAILMSTYNGEKFLPIQVESLFNQTLNDFIIYVRDDGSTDNTINILKHYSESYPDKICLMEDADKHLGPAKSFMRLLKNVDADYYFFCDQDDFWLEGKVMTTLQVLSKYEGNGDIPVIVHTDAKVVDENLQEIHSSLWKLMKVHPERLDNRLFLPVCYTVTGCTMAINREAKKITTTMPMDAQMHDSWIAFCVSQKGIVKPINAQTMLYRQHSVNAVGVLGTSPKDRFNKFVHIKKTLNEYNELASFYERNGYGSKFKWLLIKLLFFIIR